MSKIPTIIGILVIVGIAYFAYRFFLLPKTETNTADDLETKVDGTTADLGLSSNLASDEKEAISTVVHTLIDGLINSAPPKSDTKALENAFLQLSDTGRSKVPRVNNRYQLGAFLGIENAPSQGYEITAMEKLNGTTEVAVTLKYPSTNVTRVLILSKVNEAWRIDGVRNSQ